MDDSETFTVKRGIKMTRSKMQRTLRQRKFQPPLKTEARTTQKQMVTVVAFDGGFDWFYNQDQAIDAFIRILKDPDYREIYLTYYLTELSPRDERAQERINREIDRSLDLIETSAEWVLKKKEVPEIE